jgi:DNA polymerase III delta subunit
MSDTPKCDAALARLADAQRPRELTEHAAAVRRSAITEAVDRLTDAEIFDLVFAMTTARIPQGRELLRRALTEGT